MAIWRYRAKSREPAEFAPSAMFAVTEAIDLVTWLRSETTSRPRSNRVALYS